MKQMVKYSTNFVKGKHGNTLVEDELKISLNGNPVYITGQLFKNGMFRKKLIQLEQTGTRANPDPNSITFEMYKPGKVRMESGTYTIKTYAYFKGVGGKSWTDKFHLQ